MVTEKITPQEENVLQVLWALGDGTVKDILTATPENERQPYTTVASVVKNLERSNFISSLEPYAERGWGGIALENYRFPWDRASIPVYRAMAR